MKRKSDIVRLNTPSKSTIRLGGFSDQPQCEHDCDSHFFERETALEFADTINFYWANMRRSLAALTDDECKDMNASEYRFMGKWWEDHKQLRLPASSGPYRITHRENEKWHGWFTDDQLDGRMVPPGKWTLLVEDLPPDEKGRPQPPITWMSDTPVEIADQMEVYEVAHGRVLFNGLGLGIMQEWLLKDKPCIQHMDIVEINPHIIELISPYLEKYGDRVTLHHGDAYTIQLEGEWDVVFHDVWPDISPDNLPLMEKLCRRYASRTVWQGCWARKQCEGMRDVIKSYEKLARARGVA